MGAIRADDLAIHQGVDLDLVQQMFTWHVLWARHLSLVLKAHAEDCCVLGLRSSHSHKATLVTGRSQEGQLKGQEEGLRCGKVSSLSLQL